MSPMSHFDSKGNVPYVLCMRATKQDIFGLGIILNCNMSCLIYLFHLFFYLVKQCVCVYSAKAFSDFFVHFDSFSFVSWFFLKLFYHRWLTKSKCFLFFYLFIAAPFTYRVYPLKSMLLYVVSVFIIVLLLKFIVAVVFVI